MNAPRNLLKEKNERMKQCPQCDTGYPDSHATCPTHGVLLNEIRDLKPGMLIHKAYRIVRKLGQGGMGAVYLAQHIFMEEPRALKFLSAELSQDEAFTGRFRREVRTLRQLRHNNVVDCGDLEPAEDDSLFFPMEFVDGPDLRAFLNSVKGTGFSEKGTGFSPYIESNRSDGVLTPEGTLPVEQALHLTRQIAEGLGAAHAKGMVHRDIKPENILMAREAGAWLPKIADFGIVATKESSDVFTRTGGTLLTMTYAAPEQWRGTPAAELDGRTDLYALGGLLYEMLTGQTPFQAESYEGWAWQHQTTPPQPPSALRPELANWQGLDALVLHLLAKNREDRPKDVAELLGLLDAVRLVQPEARRKTVKEDTGKQSDVKRNRSMPIWVWTVTAAVLLALAFAAVRIFVPKQTHVPVSKSSAQKQESDPYVSIAKPIELTADDIETEATPAIRKPGDLQKKKPDIFDQVTSEKAKDTKPSINKPDFVAIEKQAEVLVKQERYAEAKPLLDRACTDGSWEACESLGNIYLHGDGVSQDLSRTISLYTKACNESSAGCVNLGIMYKNGNGVIQDRLKAAMLYSKACDSDSADGCYFLGMMYMIGEGIEKNNERARELFKKSCSMGEEHACTEVAKLK
jgi:serine/threonine protein kinase